MWRQSDTPTPGKTRSTKLSRQKNFFEGLELQLGNTGAASSIRIPREQEMEQALGSQKEGALEIGVREKDV